jgi:hypothetical protein
MQDYEAQKPQIASVYAGLSVGLLSPFFGTSYLESSA